jgi:predicted AAA+ superfamily ATPase
MYFHRFLSSPLRSPVSRGKVRLLLGARQTGKSALLNHLLPPDDTKIFTLQDSALRRRFEQDPSRFAGEVKALPPKIRYVIVDEIQKVPALRDEAQALYDGDLHSREYFLTGSSARRLLHGSANLLPGRCHLYHLMPVTRWEQSDWTAFHSLPESMTPVASRTETIHPLFPSQSLNRHLLWGSLPGVMGEPDDTAAATLVGYVETYLEEEIRREAVVRDLGAFGIFLKLAAVESGKIVNLSSLSQESGVPQSTLKNFYQVLENTLTGYRMSPYARPGRKRILSSPRFYLFDLGVRTAAAGLPFDPRLLEAEGGPLLEHWIALELIHRARYSGRGHGVSFWRTVSGAEVDLVWESPAEDIPIEVKWTSRPSVSDARHVETFLSEFPRRAKRGFVVCRCEAPQQLTPRVTALPWSTL